LEYLIDDYCSEETFHQDMEKVVRRLKENFVYGAEAEKIRHQIRENRSHSVIANLEARLVETEDKYWGSISGGLRGSVRRFRPHRCSRGSSRW
jgi:ATP-dependent Lon protease